MMKRYCLISVLIIVCCQLFSTSAYFQNDNAYTVSSKSRKEAHHKASLAKKEEYIKNGPYIVHLKPDIHLQSFQSILHSRHLLSSSNSTSTMLRNAIEFETKLVDEILPNVVIVYGMKHEDILQLPQVLRITPNSMRHIRTAEETVPLALPWGIDRINQDELPLDHQYYANYTGANIDVYIVDTGIDTTHDEFTPQAGVTREVKNVYNDFATSKKNPAANTDDVGHGTHVAGTIGGRNVGISPHANIYGLKILNSDGEGSVDAILLALNYVVQLVKKSKKLSIVSMSLGGPCEVEDDCKSDTLVRAVEKLSTIGIFTSVASGNEGCNACYGSPNAAESAINVAASDQEDIITYFSNFGQCIDIIAPGWDILSSCSSLLTGCSNKHSYIKMSGTSMACPHATGVIVQVLEKFSEYYTLHGKSLITNPITVKDVLQELSCRSSKNHVTLELHDSITKNFLLHTPKRVSSTSATSGVVDILACQYETDCLNSCSNNGFCMIQPPLVPTIPTTSNSIVTTAVAYSLTQNRAINNNNNNNSVHSGSSNNAAHNDSRTLAYRSAITSSSTFSGTDTNNDMCYCENGFYGQNCKLTTDPYCTSATHTTIKINMYDSFGDGWSFSNFKIINITTGFLVDNAMDSLCSGDSGNKKFCLTDGDYNFQVTRGYFPAENSWDMCGSSGGSPYTSQLHIHSGVCTITCSTENDESLQLLTLIDKGGKNGNGWEGAYYTIFNEATGKQIYGGTMLAEGKAQKTHALCLPKSTSTMVCSLFFIQLPLTGDNGEVAFHICDYMNGKPQDLIRICVDSNTGICTARKLNHPPPTDITVNSCQGAGNNNITFFLFDTSMNGWSHNQIEVLNENDSSNSDGTSGSSGGITYDHLIKSDQTVGFANQQSVCIPDGCYSLNITYLPSSSSSRSSRKSTSGNGFLNVCNFLTGIPLQTRMCVEQKYGLCYGLENCLNLVSYAKMSDFQYTFITQYSKKLKIDEIVYNDVAHNAHALCDLKDGCYQLTIGGGRYYNADTSMNRNRAVICGNHLINLPFYGSLCISHNMTQCVVVEDENVEEPLTCRPISSHSHKHRQQSKDPVNTEMNTEADIPLVNDVVKDAKTSSTVTAAVTDSIPIMIVMLDLYGDGWTGSAYEISLYNNSDSSINNGSGSNEGADAPTTDDFFGGGGGDSSGGKDDFFGGSDVGSGGGGITDDYFNEDGSGSGETDDYFNSPLRRERERHTQDINADHDQVNWNYHRDQDFLSSSSTNSKRVFTESSDSDSSSLTHSSIRSSNVQQLSPQLFTQLQDFRKQYHHPSRSFSSSPLLSTTDTTHTSQSAIHTSTTSTLPLFSGTLTNGQFGQTIHCLTINQCYTFTLIAKKHADEVLWLMCGLVGDASANNLIFCVTANGCEFQNIHLPPSSTTTDPKDNYYNTVDDDFYPQNHALDPTRAPIVNNKPTKSPAQQVTPIVSPVIINNKPTHKPTYVPSLAHNVLPPLITPPTNNYIFSSSPTTNNTDNTETSSTSSTDTVSAATRIKILMFVLVFGILSVIICLVIALLRHLKRNRSSGSNGSSGEQTISLTTYNPLSKNDNTNNNNSLTGKDGDDENNNNNDRNYEMTNISMKPTLIQPKSQKQTSSSQQPSKSIYSSLLSQTRATLTNSTTSGYKQANSNKNNNKSRSNSRKQGTGNKQGNDDNDDDDDDYETLQLQLSPQEREHTIHFQSNDYNDDRNNKNNRSSSNSNNNHTYDEDIYDDYEREEEEHDVLRSNKYTNNKNTRNRRNSSIGLLSSIKGLRKTGGSTNSGINTIDDEIIDMRV